MVDGDFDERLDWFWSKLKKYLASKQLKQTQQRKSIIAQFLKIRKHADAENIHNALRKNGQNIGLATIYRTLNMLKNAGLVEQHSFEDGRAVYELISPGDHHDHLICKSCGKIDEFEHEGIEELQQKIAEERGYLLLSHRLDLYGLCESCKHQKDSFR